MCYMVKLVSKQRKKQMEKTQREYYLNEQIKAIHKELGDLGENGGGGRTSTVRVRRRLQVAPVVDGRLDVGDVNGAHGARIIARRPINPINSGK